MQLARRFFRQHRSQIRAVAEQLASLTTKDPDVHALTNRLFEWLKQPDKMHGLRKTVLLLYQGEDPDSLKAKIQLQYENVHRQTEFDIGLLREKLDAGSSSPTGAGSSTTPDGSAPDLDAVKQTNKAPAPGSTDERALSVEDLLPAISSSKKIYSGVILGPEMVPVDERAFKNSLPFERISFAKILQTREKFVESHKHNLITLALERLAFSGGGAQMARAIAAETRPACQLEWAQRRAADLEGVLSPGDGVRLSNTRSMEEGLFVETIVVPGGGSGVEASSSTRGGGEGRSSVGGAPGGVGARPSTSSSPSATRTPPRRRTSSASARSTRWSTQCSSSWECSCSRSPLALFSRSAAPLASRRSSSPRPGHRPS